MNEEAVANACNSLLIINPLSESFICDYEEHSDKESCPRPLVVILRSAATKNLFLVPLVVILRSATTKNLYEVSTLYYVYILANWNNKVLYVGVTNNLERRLFEHKNQLIDGFTKKYHVHKLVYFSETTDVTSAIAKEKQIKGWTRAKKNALIEENNPDWHDLSND